MTGMGFGQAALRRELLEISNIEVRTLPEHTLPEHALAEHGQASAEQRPAHRGWRLALSRIAARLPFGALVQLVAHRPDLVVSEAFGPKAVQAALYRILSPRSRLLLCATEPPRRFGRFARMILSRADGFVAHEANVVDAIEQLRFPVRHFYPMVAPPDLDLFHACSRNRSGVEAHRIVYAGDLSPESGAADVLICLAAWAEQRPDRAVEIWWVGDGDLSGVLEAQPLPGNMSQRLLGRLDRQAMAEVFAQCGILVIPPLAEDTRPLVLAALAAGLVVLDSRRPLRGRHVIQDGALGWTFDPLDPDDMLRALDRALESSPDELDRMRDIGRAFAGSSAAESFADRVREAIAAVLSGGIPSTGAARPS